MASASPQPEASTSSKPLDAVVPSAGSSSLSKLVGKPKKKAISPGIVYISRIPPGMTPQKIKHLMGRWGETGKVYAQKDGPSGGDPGSKSKTHSVRYTEAWIEFLNKAVAKSAADMLNAQPIGGAKGERWRDDIWTMKYLPGFKWEMLGEQVAYERNSHSSRLRQELSRSKTEQSDYLRNVELARVLDKRREKKAAAAGAAGTTADKAQIEVGGEKGKRKYEQRGREEGAEGASKKRSKRKGGDDGAEGASKLQDVLGSVF